MRFRSLRSISPYLLPHTLPASHRGHTLPRGNPIVYAWLAGPRPECTEVTDSTNSSRSSPSDFPLDGCVLTCSGMPRNHLYAQSIGCRPPDRVTSSLVHYSTAIFHLLARSTLGRRIGTYREQSAMGLQ
jgi:hypothetical protein